jgi:hypothetical protein
MMVYNQRTQIDGELKYDVDKGVVDGESTGPLQRLYNQFEHNHPMISPNLLLGEPSMNNPCSYASVSTILKDIKDRCSVGKDRGWTVVGSDSLLYVLGSRAVEKDRALQDLLIVPGLGHYEINMGRGLFKLLFDVILIDLAKMLNFKSAKALSSFKNAFDHHKLWQAFCIFFFGTCVPYVRQCINQDKRTSLQEIYQFFTNASNPNFIFMKDIVFTYWLSLLLFRTGTRRKSNNSVVMLASRTKFANLFYGLNMTHYQEIEFKDLRMSSNSRQRTISCKQRSVLNSVSGHTSNGEGGDFVLEAYNRKTKCWMPSGVPDDSRWLKLIRNVDTLDKVFILICNILTIFPNILYMYSYIICKFSHLPFVQFFTFRKERWSLQ